MAGIWHLICHHNKSYKNILIMMKEFKEASNYHLSGDLSNILLLISPGWRKVTPWWRLCLSLFNEACFSYHKRESFWENSKKSLGTYIWKHLKFWKTTVVVLKNQTPNLLYNCQYNSLNKLSLCDLFLLSFYFIYLIVSIHYSFVRNATPPVGEDMLSTS